MLAHIFPQSLWKRCVSFLRSICMRLEIDSVCHLSHITCSPRRSQQMLPSRTLYSPSTLGTVYAHKQSLSFSVLTFTVPLPPPCCLFYFCYHLCIVFLDRLGSVSAGLSVRVCVRGWWGVWWARSVKSRAVNLSWCLMRRHERDGRR